MSLLWGRFNSLHSALTRHLVCDLLQVDLARQVHFPRVDLEDVKPRSFIGGWELDLCAGYSRSMNGEQQN